MKLRSLTVTEANKMLKNYIEANPMLLTIGIKGQVSNLKIHSSGHCYFNLKDENAVIPCVMFKYAYESNGLELVLGDEIEATGKISVYEAGGLYQFYVNKFENAGQGKLHILFEKLKEKLSAKGYFDLERKREISFPKKVAIITSTSGAVISDILKISKRRTEYVDFVIIPSLVQGEMATESIINSIERANKLKDIDAIILARGGGTMEDLWCFNEEAVAHSIYNSKLPIISAIGHETDFTISDFVADIRASTPSAAAELITQDYVGLEYSLKEIGERMDLNMSNRIEILNRELSAFSPIRFKHKMLSAISELQISNDLYNESMERFIDKMLMEKIYLLDSFGSKLEQSSPLKILSKGYGIAKDSKGKILSSVNEAKARDSITLRLKDGELGCTIEKVISEDN